MRKGKGYRDHWQFHFNDWMDNGTFHNYEEDMNEQVPESNEEDRVSRPSIPVRAVQNTRSGLLNTGRFDQFNDEFDGNFNHHSYDSGERDIVQDAEGPSGTQALDEYNDDPYKITKDRPME
jgi:hypothetical protein